ncbi:MAG: cupin domain-containing protein [Phormidesmis sp.]
MTVNLKSFLVEPDHGDAYWFGVDLYTFKATGDRTGQTYALFEALIQPQSGAPPHTHSLEDESFYVRSGEFEFRLDDNIVTATADTFLYSPKGQLHSFTNVGTIPAKLLIWVTPAGFEKFMAEVGTAATANQIVPATQLSPDDLSRIVKVAQKYGMEFFSPTSADT